MPRPIDAARTCSTVWILTSPQAIVVPRTTPETLLKSAIISTGFSRSVLTNTIPEFTGAGINLIVTLFPV
jgi:hypothetical protein